MSIFIAALALAAAPVDQAAPAPPMQHAQGEHGNMDQMGHPGDMAEMKDCCCHDMMAKMHDGMRHDGKPGEHSGHGTSD